MNRLKTFLSLTGREFRLFKNNPIMVMLFIGGPILYGIIFGAMYQKGKFTDLPVMVVDKDNSSMSTRFIDMLNDMDVFIVDAETLHRVERLERGQRILAAIRLGKTRLISIEQRDEPGAGRMQEKAGKED